MPSPRFAAFLAAHPPDTELAPCTDADLDPYREWAPEPLIAFWTEVGFGWFGQGLLQIVDPVTLSDGLALLLGGSSHKRFPLVRTAFGEIFYYRDMREEARALAMSGANPGELGDISNVDVHHGEVGVTSLDVEEFFNSALCDPENVEGYLRKSLVERAREMLGPLAPSECFGFVPALALGGYEDIGSVQKMDMYVHWSILRQMT